MNKKSIYSLIILFVLGLAKSNAQDFWKELFLPDSVEVYMIAFDTAGTHYVASNKGVYISEDGNQWEQSKPHDHYNFVNNIHITENNTIYTGMNYLFRSIDDGMSWDSIFYSPSGGINSIFTQGDSNIFLGSWGKVFRSTDSAQTWVQVIDTFNSESFNAITANSSGMLFAGSTQFVGGGSPGGVYRSFDNGTSWELSNLDYHSVSSLVINSTDEIYAGTMGHFYTSSIGIYKSDNNGLSWENVFSGNSFKSLAINQYDAIAVGCRVNFSPGGIFISTNEGETWEEITNNLPTNSFRQVLFSPDNYLFTVTHSDHRLFKTEVPVSIQDSKGNNTNNEILVFPNPAKNEIQIKLSNDNNTSFCITSMSGVKVLDVIAKSKMEYVKINIENLKPGLYIIHCTNDSQNYNHSKFIKY